MNTRRVYTILLCLLTIACGKKPATDDIKAHLEKAMTDKLLSSQPAGSPQPHFQIVDVNYFKIGPFYRCQFAVKLQKPDGADTTGYIQAKISDDFSEVIK